MYVIVRTAVLNNSFVYNLFIYMSIYDILHTRESIAVQPVIRTGNACTGCSHTINPLWLHNPFTDANASDSHPRLRPDMVQTRYRHYSAVYQVSSIDRWLRRMNDRAVCMKRLAAPRVRRASVRESTATVISESTIFTIASVMSCAQSGEFEIDVMKLLLTSEKASLSVMTSFLGTSCQLIV